MVDYKNLRKILNELPKKETNLHLNSKVLVVDGLNSFIRAFVTNPLLNDNGVHVGGIIGFFYTLGYAIKLIDPTRVVIVFDGPGGSVRRREMYPDYKNRKATAPRILNNNMYITKEDEDKAKTFQIKRLVKYLSCFPVQSTIVKNIEADDAIAYYANNSFGEDSKCYIMSTDKDYLQLISDRVIVYNPTSKVFYDKNRLKEDFNILAENFHIYKSLIGDNSDNIKGIKGAGYKTLNKRVPILFGDKKITVDDIIEYVSKKFEQKDKKGKKLYNYKLYEHILEEKEKLKLNVQLIQLHVPIIKSSTIALLDVQLDAPINSLDRSQLYTCLYQDRTAFGNFKNPDSWLSETFFKLEHFSKENK